MRTYWSFITSCLFIILLKQRDTAGRWWLPCIVRNAAKVTYTGSTGYTRTMTVRNAYPRSVLKYSTDKQTCYLHATQKPVALLEYFIRTYTNEGDLVVDFVMGSGSTGIACRNTGRRFIGIEKEETIFQIAKERLTL